MNFFAISTLILLITASAVLGILKPLMSASLRQAAHNTSEVTAQEIKDSVILKDLPPPDDTYTPDQRRFS